MTLFFLNERQWHIHIAEFTVFLFNSFFCGKWWKKFPKNTKNILGYMQPLSLSWGTNFFYTLEDLLTSLLKCKRSLKQDQSTSIKLTPWQSWISHIGKTFFLVSRKNPLTYTNTIESFLPFHSHNLTFLHCPYLFIY